MIIIFKVLIKFIYFKNIYKFCDNQITFIWFFSANKTSDIQTGNLNCRMAILLTIVSPWKWDLFHNKKYIHMYINRSTHSKVTGKQRFKRDFRVAQEKNIEHMIAIFGVRKKIIYIKIISKIRYIRIIFMWLIA